MGSNANRQLDLPLPVGAVIGILGGGQLGRMTATAASRLGFYTVVLAPDVNAPAAQIANYHIAASYDDLNALGELADLADVVTYELEQLPLASVEWLSKRVPVAPGCRALEVSQDRIKEKSFLEKIGVRTARWQAIASEDELLRYTADFGGSSILKVAYGGYDGKGQAALEAGMPAAQLRDVWRQLSGGAEMAAILEAKIDFECELSVIVARDRSGHSVTYDPGLNIHKNHILDTTIVPAGIPIDVEEEAREMGTRVAQALEFVGVMCLELFLGRNGELLANEIAPRPHNSGHWTLDACYTDQFEQLVRAICGLPLGSAERFANATMKNILGPVEVEIARYLGESNAKIHLYGKEQGRPNRKMGHVTLLEERRATTAPGLGDGCGDATGDVRRLH